MERTILHCDLNNYFASVECLTHPEWRDVPMAVCGSVEERHGIVLAKNYPARAYGIKTGDTVFQAKAKCPHIVIAPTHYGEYMRYSKIVRKIYEDYTDEIEPMGIDECWLDVTGSLRLFGGAVKIADTLRERVKRETGLTISVGVSFNKPFSKLASDLKKPDATTVIDRSNFRETVWPLAADSMIGIGRSTMRTLFSHGCRTIGDLAACDRDTVKKWLGKSGEMLWNFANGYDETPVSSLYESIPMKSVGRGITTAVDMCCLDSVKDVIIELVQEVGERLREENMLATGVSVMVRDCDLSWREFQRRLTNPTKSTRELIEAATELFRERCDLKKPLRSVTVRAINLIPSCSPLQLGLFDNNERRERLIRLETTVDGIRRRYGTHAVCSGTYIKSERITSKIAEPHQSFVVV